MIDFEDNILEKLNLSRSKSKNILSQPLEI